MNQLGKKYDSLAQAISSQSGSSGGSVTRVPDLLLRVLKVPTFSDLNGLTCGGIETVDGVECHKVSGVRQGKLIDLWIAKTDLLLRKLHTSTPFGDITETHQNIKINGKIEDAAVSFTPPPDAEHVDKFDMRKNFK